MRQSSESCQLSMVHGLTMQYCSTAAARSFYLFDPPKRGGANRPTCLMLVTPLQSNRTGQEGCLCLFGCVRERECVCVGACK